MTEHIITSL